MLLTARQPSCSRSQVHTRLLVPESLCLDLDHAAVLLHLPRLLVLVCFQEVLTSCQCASMLAWRIHVTGSTATDSYSIHLASAAARHTVSFRQPAQRHHTLTYYSLQMLQLFVLLLGIHTCALTVFRLP